MGDDNPSQLHASTAWKYFQMKYPQYKKVTRVKIKQDPKAFGLFNECQQEFKQLRGSVNKKRAKKKQDIRSYTEMLFSEEEDEAKEDDYVKEMALSPVALCSSPEISIASGMTVSAPVSPSSPPHESNIRENTLQVMHKLKDLLDKNRRETTKVQEEVMQFQANMRGLKDDITESFKKISELHVKHKGCEDIYSELCRKVENLNELFTMTRSELNEFI